MDREGGAAASAVSAASAASQRLSFFVVFSYNFYLFLPKIL
jgi:hypothetical protein